MFPAFKEWHAIVGALAAGQQTLILRKGGIAEPRGGFRPRGEPFWLLPTWFHAQTSKLTAAATPFLPADDVERGRVTLTCWAQLHAHQFLTAWPAVDRLAPHHLWTAATVRERFDWATPPGVHLLVVRVHRLDTPLAVELTSAQAGCRSWVELPDDPTAMPSRPALDDASFHAAVAAIGT